MSELKRSLKGRKALIVAVALITVPVLSGSLANGASGQSKSSVVTQQSNTFVVPQQIGVPPDSYLNAQNQLIGLNPDLATGVGKELGLQTKNVRTTFANSLLGMERGIYPTVPGADITPARLKLFDFASTLRDGYGLEVPYGGITIAASLSALCGLKIAVTAGSSPEYFLQAKSSSVCTKARKKPITISTYPDWASENLAVKSGRAVAATEPISTLGYTLLKSPKVFKVTGPYFNYVTEGFVTLKTSGWAPKICRAVNKLIASGKYAAIFKRYNSTNMEIHSCEVYTH